MRGRRSSLASFRATTGRPASSLKSAAGAAQSEPGGKAGVLTYQDHPEGQGTTATWLTVSYGQPCRPLQVQRSYMHSQLGRAQTCQFLEGTTPVQRSSLLLQLVRGTSSGEKSLSKSAGCLTLWSTGCDQHSSFSNAHTNVIQAVSSPGHRACSA